MHDIADIHYRIQANPGSTEPLDIRLGSQAMEAAGASERPTKRARLQDEPQVEVALPEVPSATSVAIPINDEQYWFEDGNVIIVAGAVQFRLYKGPLMRHSSLFANMFSAPQSSAPSVKPVQDQDVPIFYVAETPDDIRQFLRCVTLGNDIRVDINYETASFDQISTHLRMGHKFQIIDLLRPTLRFLKRLYPSNLDDYSKRMVSWNAYSPRLAIIAINLARLTNTPAVLVAAFLDCTTLDVDTLVEGTKGEDGRQEKLSEEDIRRVLVAKTELIKADAQDAIRIFSPDAAPQCPIPSQCIPLLLLTLKNVHNPPSFSPVWSLSWKTRRPLVWQRLCPKCAAMLDQRISTARRALWDRLPVIFGL
ncbi:hypothetical protein C2E23DRAFT_507552 [Lenzites betulinus]|nr:hypothetical protein C2E23DRAFT_507552 [Lenzites betulinus]